MHRRRYAEPIPFVLPYHQDGSCWNPQRALPEIILGQSEKDIRTAFYIVQIQSPANVRKHTKHQSLKTPLRLGWALAFPFVADCARLELIASFTSHVFCDGAARAPLEPA